MLKTREQLRLQVEKTKRALELRKAKYAQYEVLNENQSRKLRKDTRRYERALRDAGAIDRAASDQTSLIWRMLNERSMWDLILKPKDHE